MNRAIIYFTAVIICITSVILIRKACENGFLHNSESAENVYLEDLENYELDNNMDDNGDKKPEREVNLDIDELGEESMESSDKESLEYIALADSKDDAEELAKGYGMELIRYSNGVAVFKSDKSFFELQKIGDEKNLNKISPNYTRATY